MPRMSHPSKTRLTPPPIPSVSSCLCLRLERYVCRGPLHSENCSTNNLILEFVCLSFGSPCYPPISAHLQQRRCGGSRIPEPHNIGTRNTSFRGCLAKPTPRQSCGITSLYTRPGHFGIKPLLKRPTRMFLSSRELTARKKQCADYFAERFRDPNALACGYGRTTLSPRTFSKRSKSRSR